MTSAYACFYVHVCARMVSRTWLTGTFLCRVSVLFVFGLCAVRSVCGMFVLLVGGWAC